MRERQACMCSCFFWRAWPDMSRNDAACVTGRVCRWLKPLVRAPLRVRGRSTHGRHRYWSLAASRQRLERCGVGRQTGWAALRAANEAWKADHLAGAQTGTPGHEQQSMTDGIQAASWFRIGKVYCIEVALRRNTLTSMMDPSAAIHADAGSGTSEAENVTFESSEIPKRPTFGN